MENNYHFLCEDCNYLWESTTYKSLEYREGYNCPKCGSKNIAGEETKNDYSGLENILTNALNEVAKEDGFIN